MRILLVVVFVLLISETITKHKRHRHTKKDKPSTRKLDEIREMLDKIEAILHWHFRPWGLRQKINSILENVSDLKSNRTSIRSKKENDEYSGYGSYEFSGSGLSSGNGPKDKSKLLSGKVDTILENMSDLKTTIYNALNGKMRDAKQNEDNPSTKPRTKPAKNLPHQEIEESAAYQSGSGDMD